MPHAFTPRRRERGMVTAETAVLAPFAVTLAVVMLWLVCLGVAQVRLTDASREAARLLARGDDEGRVQALVREQGPEGTTLTVTRAGGMVTVRATVQAGLPLPGLGRRTLTAESVSADESAP